jgi:hypothetical protein
LDNGDGGAITLTPMFGQSRSKKNKIVDSKAAKIEFIKTDPLMKGLLKKRMSSFLMWVRWICHRGAAGNGAVYERNNLVGMAVTATEYRFQAGGRHGGVIWKQLTWNGLK